MKNWKIDFHLSLINFYYCINEISSLCDSFNSYFCAFLYMNWTVEWILKILDSSSFFLSTHCHDMLQFHVFFLSLINSAFSCPPSSYSHFQILTYFTVVYFNFFNIYLSIFFSYLHYSGFNFIRYNSFPACTKLVT